MSNKIICWMGVIMISIYMSLSAQAFVVNGSSWTAGEATFHTAPFSTTGSGLSSTQLENAFIEALGRWSNNTNFEYKTTSGFVGEPCPALDSISSNVENNENGFTFDSVTCSGASLVGVSTLAVARTISSGSAILHSSVVFNSTRNWGIYSGPQGFNTSFDFTRVAVHELGHTLGLDHTQNFNSAIMLPIVGDIEEPQQDDLEGVAFLYGAVVAADTSFGFIPAILMLLLDDE